MVRNTYTPKERLWLWSLGVVGFFGVNGVFIYGVVSQPETAISAFRNPVAAAFVAESLLLVAALAYLLRKWRVTRLHWAAFVGLSVLGSIAFALPAAILWRGSEPED